MSKELNETLVMTTCKCRGNDKNLVMTRAYFEDIISLKVAQEQKRIIELIERLPFIWGGTTQMIQTSRNDVIALIRGEANA
jgi:hypothetical protein